MGIRDDLGKRSSFMKMLLPLLIFPLFALWFWWPLSPRKWVKSCTLSLLAASSLPVVVYFWRNQWLSPAATAWLQLWVSVVVTTFLFGFLWLIVRELGWLISKLVRRPAGAQRWHGAQANITALVLTLLLTGIGTWNGLKPPAVHEQVLELSSLPEAMDGLRVAVLADIHASPVKGAWRTTTIVVRTLAAQPDLIVLPGDLVDGPVPSTGPEVNAIAQLHAPYGVWIAPGNHEYYSDYNAWMTHFRSLGLKTLENQSVNIDINGARLALSGVGDPTFYRKGPVHHDGGIAPDIPAVVQQAQGSDFHILIAHQPKLAREAAATGRIDLQISGHTHGGHIVGMDRWLVAPFNDGFVRGRYQIGSMALYVVPGAGLWDGFSTRLGVPAKINVFILKKGG